MSTATVSEPAQPAADTSVWIERLLLLFLSIVIVCGESFKIRDVNVAGVALILLAIPVAMSLIGRSRAVPQGPAPVLVGPAIVFAGLGLVRYAPGDVFEDVLPFGIVLMVLVSLAQLKPADHLRILRIVVCISALVLLKALAIRFLDVEPAWGGNTFWQGARFEQSPGVMRVILKGADVFMGTSVVIVLVGLMLRVQQHLLAPWASAVVAAALWAAVSLSYTRATLGSVLAATLVSPLLLSWARAIHWRRAVVVISAVLATTAVTLLLDAGLRQRLFSGVVALAPASHGEAIDRLTSGTRPAAGAPGRRAAGPGRSGTTRPAAGGTGGGPPPDYALAFRQNEAAAALRVARQDQFLGSGFGAHYFTEASGSRKPDGRSLFVHSLPVWLILKVGVVGAGLFYLVLGLSIRRTLTTIRSAGQGLPAVHVTLLAAAVAGLVYLSVNDLLNNKFATASGAAAYGLLLSFGATQPGRSPRHS